MSEDLGKDMFYLFKGNGQYPTTEAASTNASATSQNHSMPPVMRQPFIQNLNPHHNQYQIQLPTPQTTQPVSVEPQNNNADPQLVLSTILNQAATVQGNLQTIVATLSNILNQPTATLNDINAHLHNHNQKNNLYNSQLTQSSPPLQNLSGIDVETLLQSLRANGTLQSTPAVVPSSQSVTVTRSPSGSSLIRTSKGTPNTLRSLLVDTIVSPQQPVTNATSVSSVLSSPTCSPNSSEYGSSKSGSINSSQILDDRQKQRDFNQIWHEESSDTSSISSTHQHIKVNLPPWRNSISDTGSRRLHRQDSGLPGHNNYSICDTRNSISDTGSSRLHRQSNDSFHGPSDLCSAGSGEYSIVKQRRVAGDNGDSWSSSVTSSASTLFTANSDQIVSSEDHSKNHKSHRLQSLSSSSSGKKIPRLPSLGTQFPSQAQGLELKILRQPEEHHRARYMTEGSRGAVKDRSGENYPTIQLLNWDRPATVQVFVATDSGRVRPHGYYQACRVSGKHCCQSKEKNFDGTNVIEINFERVISIDCVGILKLRNADVEQRIGIQRTKKKSTKARLAYRINIPRGDGTFITIQSVSEPILCTQPIGSPEISRMSLTEGSCLGQMDLFIIGRNFVKETQVLFEEVVEGTGTVWHGEAEIETEYFQQNHFICQVPPFKTPDIKSPVTVQVVVVVEDRRSEPHYFTYLPENKSKMVTDSLHSLSIGGLSTSSSYVSPEALEINRIAARQNWLAPIDSSCANSRAGSTLYQPISRPTTGCAVNSFTHSGRAPVSNTDIIMNDLNEYQRASSTRMLAGTDIAVSGYSNTSSSSVNTLHSYSQDYPRSTSIETVPGKGKEHHQTMLSSQHIHSSSIPQNPAITISDEMDWNKTPTDNSGIYLSSSLDSQIQCEFLLNLEGSSSAAESGSISTLTESTEYLAL